MLTPAFAYKYRACQNRAGAVNGAARPRRAEGANVPRVSDRFSSRVSVRYS